MWVNREEWEALKRDVDFLNKLIKEFYEFKSLHEKLRLNHEQLYLLFDAIKEELESGKLITTRTPGNFGWEIAKPDNVSEKVNLLLKHFGLEVTTTPEKKYLAHSKKAKTI